MFDINGLGEKIRTYRRSLGLTQTELAEKLKVSFQAISGWECGTTLPDISNLCRLATVFGVSVDSLLRGEEDGEIMMLGIDGGGTKSEYAVFSPSGHLRMTFKLPATNASVVGLDESVDILGHGIELCLSKGIKLAGVFIGNAGSLLSDIRTRLCRRYPDTRIDIGSDSYNVFSCAPSDAALICGTGSILLVREGEHFRNIGGWGYRIGDPGSAFNLGKLAIAEAFAYEDKITDTPLFFKLVCEKMGFTQIRHSFAGKTVAQIAEISSAVFEAYALGEEAAKNILHREFSELARLINAALPNGGRIVASGGVIEHNMETVMPILREYVRQDIEFIIPKLPPIYGACVECCRRMCIPKDENFYQNFAEDYRTLTAK